MWTADEPSQGMYEILEDVTDTVICSMIVLTSMLMRQPTRKTSLASRQPTQKKDQSDSLTRIVAYDSVRSSR